MIPRYIRFLCITVAAMTCFLGMSVEAQATTISYKATNVAGATWRYDYTVTNDSLNAALFEFTVFFDRTQYENLAVQASPVAWDSLVVQPDNGLPDDGFFDSLNTATGMAVGASRSGFSVRFDFLGTGSPGSQAFHVVDPDTFLALQSGNTFAVPLPGAGALLGTGALLLSGKARRRKGHQP